MVLGYIEKKTFLTDLKQNKTMKYALKNTLLEMLPNEKSKEYTCDMTPSRM